MKAIIGILVSIAFSLGVQVVSTNTPDFESMFTFRKDNQAESPKPSKFNSQKKWGQSQLANYADIKKKLRYLYASECVDLNESKTFSILVSAQGKYIQHKKVKEISHPQLVGLLSEISYHPFFLKYVEQPTWLKISFDFEI